MPKTLGLRDSLAALFVNDTIAYILPKDMDVEKAPSSIKIDGYATLRMERTRILGDGTLSYMVDKAVREPMTVFRAPQAQAREVQPRHDTVPNLPNTTKNSVMACLLGAALFGTVLGIGCAMASAAWGVACIAVGVFGVVMCMGVAEDKLWPAPRRAEA